MRVDAVEDVVVVVPEPVLLLHGCVHEFRVRLRLATLMPIHAGGKQVGNLLITFFVRHETACRQQLLSLVVKRLGGREEVDECQSTLLCHSLHSGGIEDKVGVLLVAIRQVAFGAQIFIRDRADKHQTRSRFAIVSLAQRVLHPGVQFVFKVLHLARSVEGFIVAKEGHDRVRLQMREPLVRRGVEALAMMHLLVRMKFLRAREGPLRNACWMGTKARGVAHMTHVAEEEFFIRVAQVKLGFDAAIPGVALSQSVADEHDPLTLGRRSHGLSSG